MCMYVFVGVCMLICIHIILSVILSVITIDKYVKCKEVLTLSL